MNTTAVAPAAAVPAAAAGSTSIAPRPALGNRAAGGGTGSLAGAVRFVGRFAGRVAVQVALVVAVLVLAAVAVGPHVFGYRTVTMLTGSMRPSIPPGAVVVDTPEPLSQLRAGQVVSFHAPIAGRPVFTHRVVSIERRDGRVLIRTRGDANSGNDPWLAEVHGSTVWRVRAVLPYLGDGIRLLRSGSTHLLVVWVLPAAALLWFLVGVWREGGEPACIAPVESSPYPGERPSSSSATRSSSSPSSSRRRSAARPRSRKRRQRQLRSCRRRQRRCNRRKR